MYKSEEFATGWKMLGVESWARTLVHFSCSGNSLTHSLGANIMIPDGDFLMRVGEYVMLMQL